jgi:hypothetical protein
VTIFQISWSEQSFTGWTGGPLLIVRTVIIIIITICISKYKAIAINNMYTFVLGTSNIQTYSYFSVVKCVLVASPGFVKVFIFSCHI